MKHINIRMVLAIPFCFIIFDSLFNLGFFDIESEGGGQALIFSMGLVCLGYFLNSFRKFSKGMRNISNIIGLIVWGLLAILGIALAIMSIIW